MLTDVGTLAGLPLISEPVCPGSSDLLREACSVCSTQVALASSSRDAEAAQ